MARKPARAKRSVVAEPGHSYLEWAPVLGGVAVALAISTILFNFGASIGLAIDAPLRGEGKDSALGVIASGIWLVWAALVSAMAGGYLAGVMRRRWADATPQQVEMRDGIHGLTVWAVSTLAMAAGTAVIVSLSAIGAAETGTAAELSQEAAQMARNTGVIFGFATAAGATLSAAVAWWAATLGGEHRDEGIDVYEYVPAFLRN